MKHLHLLLVLLMLSFVLPPASQAAFLPVQPIEQTSQEAMPPVRKMTRKQRKEMRRNLKAQKQQLKNWKNNPQATTDEGMLILAIIFAILIPCVGVLIHQGNITIDFWIALLLMFLIWIPGVIYALYVVLTK